MDTKIVIFLVVFTASLALCNGDGQNICDTCQAIVKAKWPQQGQRFLGFGGSAKASAKSRRSVTENEGNSKGDMTAWMRLCRCVCQLSNDRYNNNLRKKIQVFLSEYRARRNTVQLSFQRSTLLHECTVANQQGSQLPPHAQTLPAHLQNQQGPQSPPHAQTLPALWPGQWPHAQTLPAPLQNQQGPQSPPHAQTLPALWPGQWPHAQTLPAHLQNEQGTQLLPHAQTLPARLPSSPQKSDRSSRGQERDLHQNRPQHSQPLQGLSENKPQRAQKSQNGASKKINKTPGHGPAHVSTLMPRQVDLDQHYLDDGPVHGNKMRFPARAPTTTAPTRMRGKVLGSRGQQRLSAQELRRAIDVDGLFSWPNGVSASAVGSNSDITVKNGNQLIWYNGKQYRLANLFHPKNKNKNKNKPGSQQPSPSLPTVDNGDRDYYDDGSIVTTEVPNSDPATTNDLPSEDDVPVEHDSGDDNPDANPEINQVPADPTEDVDDDGDSVTEKINEGDDSVLTDDNNINTTEAPTTPLVPDNELPEVDVPQYDLSLPSFDINNNTVINQTSVPHQKIDIFVWYSQVVKALADYNVSVLSLLHNILSNETSDLVKSD